MSTCKSRLCNEYDWGIGTSVSVLNEELYDKRGMSDVHTGARIGILPFHGAGLFFRTVLVGGDINGSLSHWGAWRSWELLRKQLRDVRFRRSAAELYRFPSDSEFLMRDIQERIFGNVI